jgi:hypothetical protein
MSDVEIASVADFHSHLRQLEPAERGFFYRGQSDSTWKVSCGAARRLAVESSDKTEIETVDSHVLIGYLDFLVDRAKARGFLPHGFAAPTSISDLELMAQLQHQGAATGLIDFTRQPLVALWFACNGSENIDGVVYILPQSVTQELSSTGTTAGNGAHMQALFMENIMGLGTFGPGKPDCCPEFRSCLRRSRITLRKDGKNLRSASGQGRDSGPA